MNIDPASFRLRMVLDADKHVEAVARKLCVPEATMKGAARRLRRRLLENFKTPDEAEALKAFWKDMDVVAHQALVAEVRARKRRTKRTLLAGVSDDECDRMLGLPAVLEIPGRSRLDLVIEFERVGARSFEERTAEDLRSRGYTHKEISVILGIPKQGLKKTA